MRSTGSPPARPFEPGEQRRLAATSFLMRVEDLPCTAVEQGFSPHPQA